MFNVECWLFDVSQSLSGGDVSILLHFPVKRCIHFL